MDEDERKVRATLQNNKYDNVFGIEADESSMSSNLRKSRDWFSKQKSSKIRTSIAGKFFSRKDTENSAFGSQLEALGADQIRALNNDYRSAVSQLISSQSEAVFTSAVPKQEVAQSTPEPHVPIVKGSE